MRYPSEEPRHYETGVYSCPVTREEVHVESNVPRPWVAWPIRIICKACGTEHVLEYDDVRQGEPVFGHE